MEIENKQHSDYDPELYKDTASEEEELTHEDRVRKKFRNMYLNDPWTGTIEQRLLDGYLYCLSKDDLSLSPEELKMEHEARLKRGVNRREVFVQTGKQGVLIYVDIGKKAGDTEEVIAKSIWIQMRIQGVELYVNIKNLKVLDDDQKENSVKEIGTDQKEAGKL